MSRKIRDIWNASLLKGASWSRFENPIASTTASKPPKAVVSYREAKNIHARFIRRNPKYHVDAFIHFYIDDIYFDGKSSGVWARPDLFFKIASHFDGIIGPDFSIYADFPNRLKEFQVYKMRAIEYACVQRGISVIINARWGSRKTWEYTIDELPDNSMLAIGTVGSGLKLQENRAPFEKGFDRLLEVKQPHTLVFIGSVNYPFIQKAKTRGVKIVQFDGDSCKYFKKRRDDRND